ncbi:MAG: hypothetical protein CMJ94_01005 [Planctomycetes bacterium]|nr:hypothetical protein [Planctomycetota bacterium]
MRVPLALGAALLLAPAASAQLPEQVPEVSQRQIDAALDRGHDWLLAHQGRSTRMGERALVLYAALKAKEGEAVPTDGPMRAFAQQLRQHDFTQTYDTACAICFLASYEPEEYFDVIERAARALIGFQESTGGFGYPGAEDLSNTQYGALGLWKAGSVGVVVPPEVWKALSRRVLQVQQKDGGFGYRGNGGATINMTTAGVGTLALCEMELRQAGELSEVEASSLQDARARGHAWLEDRMPAAGAPLRAWPCYGLYGLERLGAWGGLVHLGAHDWYQRGADTLLAQEREGGGWSGPVDTAFAVLFLARATSDDRPGIAVTSSGEEPREMAVTKSERDPEACARLRIEGNGPQIEFGVEAWNWNALRPYEWRQERGRGPRVRLVEYLIDGVCVRTQLADEAGPLLNRRFRTKLWVPRRGPLSLSMRVHLALPPGKPKDEGGQPLEPVLELGPLDFVALRAHGPAARLMEARYGQSMLAQDRPKVTASSRIATRKGLPGGNLSARCAVDGQLGTAWIARGSDSKRSLRIQPRAPMRAAKLVLHPAVAVEGGRPLAQPKLVEVLINEEQRQILLLPGDGSPGELALDPQQELESIELRVVTLQQPDPRKSAPFGFAEVVLEPARE